jgi:acyl carrier protein
MDTETIVTGFITEELVRGDRSTDVDSDTSLIAAGILDSIALLKLILFIEEQLGVKVGGQEVVPGNFETVGRIVEFVNRKKGITLG